MNLNDFDTLYYKCNIHLYGRIWLTQYSTKVNKTTLKSCFTVTITLLATTTD